MDPNKLYEIVWPAPDVVVYTPDREAPAAAEETLSDVQLQPSINLSEESEVDRLHLRGRERGRPLSANLTAVYPSCHKPECRRGRQRPP